MNWKLKAGMQKAMSAVPGGHWLNYLLQRYVTASLPRSPEYLQGTIEAAQRHLDAVRTHGPGDVESLRFFEFGAGYDLAEPLASAALGVRDRLLIDLRPLARPAMVRAAATGLRDLGMELPAPPAGGDLSDYLASVGIRYVAPADARATGLEPGSIDAVTSTSVLEHVPRPDLVSILAELDRILSPQGICSFAIDYHDHFAGADSGIGGVNFLRYSDAEWRRWNSDLQFQNRMRHGDYVELFESSGFVITAIDAVVDERLPSAPTVAAPFAGRADLDIGDGWFVLRRPPR